VEKYSKKTGLSIACMKKECGYKEEPKADAEGQEAGVKGSGEKQESGVRSQEAGTK
jgi:hypothetical protein